GAAGRVVRLYCGRAAVGPRAERSGAGSHADGTAAAREAGVGGRVIEIILAVEELDFGRPQARVAGDPGRLGAECIAHVRPVDQVIRAEQWYQVEVEVAVGVAVLAVERVGGAVDVPVIVAGQLAPDYRGVSATL